MRARSSLNSFIFSPVTELTKRELLPCDFLSAERLEAGHQNSFVHAEYHAEEQERKKLGLEREARPARAKAGMHRAGASGKISGKKQNPLGVIFIVIWLLAVFSMLFSALAEIL